MCVFCVLGVGLPVGCVCAMQASKQRKSTNDDDTRLARARARQAARQAGRQPLTHVPVVVFMAVRVGGMKAEAIAREAVRSWSVFIMVRRRRGGKMYPATPEVGWWLLLGGGEGVSFDKGTGHL
jgi:hypothetical protein